MAQKVNINYDLNSYLPSNFEVKQGLDVIDSEFVLNTSSFRVMFKDLKTEDKTEIKTFLENLEGVDSIDFDESDNYHKDNYTLFEITVKGDVDSVEASNTYNSIVKEFEKYDFTTSGDLASRNKEVIPTYVLALVILCVVIILIIMSNSIFEVFLIAFTTVISILLNKGTNIIFNSVSNITDSISVLLQLTISVIFSLILFNRYNKEKIRNKNVDSSIPLINAIESSIKSIFFSCLTVVVAISVLALMSFTIGKNLAFVLTKSIFFGFIATVLLLPGLLSIFDKAISKTKKKALRISFNKLATFNFKLRYFFLV